MALCYKDKTFCASDCTNTACTRHFGEAEREGSRLKALAFGGTTIQTMHLSL